LRSGVFPRINPVVDAGNIASAYTLIPIGLYDLDKAKPPLKLTLSRGGEVFIPIGGRGGIVLDSNIPILIDSNNTVPHLYPHRDSYVSRITSETRKILVMAAGVPGIPRGLVVKAINIVVKLFKQLGGSFYS
jgi:DNA/RNA-binding domain of Phe-tRNA-synthetase-like protein